MFGRRNPDQPADAPPKPPQESDLDLDMLDDLPEIPASDLTTPPTPPPPASSSPSAPPLTDLPLTDLPLTDPSWHAATPTILGPSVTRLLQEAEAARQRASVPDEAPAPAPTPPITQQLAPLLPEPQPVPAAEAPVAVVPPAATPNGTAAQPPARPRVIAESVIGPDDFFDGRYRSERGVRIQGNARGSIESRQYIYVEAGAQVEADLSAEDITISGDFSGKIVCRRRLEVTSTGKIEGQVQTVLLVVQEGGAIDGELRMRREAAPSEPGPA